MTEEKKKITAQTRKVIKIGGSLAITLPQEFIQRNSIKEGDDLPVLCDHKTMRVVPMSDEDFDNNIIETKE